MKITKQDAASASKSLEVACARDRFQWMFFSCPVTTQRKEVERDMVQGIASSSGEVGVSTGTSRSYTQVIFEQSRVTYHC